MKETAPVAILLSTFNGAAFLPAQLDSFVTQQDVGWVLHWRDDGSSDGSVAAMEAFAAGPGQGRCMRVAGEGHLGVVGSYMALLRAAVANGNGVVAFADQDDVWLPEKLSRGLEAMGDDAGPALYCGRQMLVDEALRPIGTSPALRVRPGLGPALTQNIATGCTVMLNPAAARLVAESDPPAPTLHDWWSYLVVAAAGGRVVADDAPAVLYRQHAANVVGAPGTELRRATAALRRGPAVFMAVLRAHVAALRLHPGLMEPRSAALLDDVAAALSAGVGARARVLLRHRLKRQSPSETLLFRLWFLVG